MGLSTETLRQFQLLYLPDITLSHLEFLRLGNLMAIVGNLIQQFGVCGECHVLLLYGGVDESRLLLVRLPHKMTYTLKSFSEAVLPNSLHLSIASPIESGASGVSSELPKSYSHIMSFTLSTVYGSL